MLEMLLVGREFFTHYNAGISSLSSGQRCRAWTPPSHSSLFSTVKRTQQMKDCSFKQDACFCAFMKVSYFQHSGLLSFEVPVNLTHSHAHQHCEPSYVTNNAIRRKGGVHLKILVALGLLNSFSLLTTT